MKANSTTFVFNDDLKPIGFLGTSDSNGIYSIGFVTLIQSCEQARLDALSGSSTNTTSTKTETGTWSAGDVKPPKTATPATNSTTNSTVTKVETPEEKRKKSVIYVILIFIGAGIVLTAIVVVVIVLIKQIKMRNSEDSSLTE
jgi:hypothetical protein